MSTLRRYLAATAVTFTASGLAAACSSSNGTQGGGDAGLDADASGMGDTATGMPTGDATSQDGSHAPSADASGDATSATDATANDATSATDATTNDATSDAGCAPLGPPDASVARVPVSVTGTTDTTFTTENHAFASLEMQWSGAPLAVAMGRQLAGYSRDYPVPNLYFLPPGSAPTVDLPGFGTAVESYEYARQPVNALAFESGAGTSYLFGPLVNPAGSTGQAALALVIPRVGHFAAGANASPTYVKSVDGTDPTNRLGWPGLWPTVQPYSELDPTILPVNTVAEQCSISTDDDPNAPPAPVVDLDYECDFNSLHLLDRATQITPTISPGASGWEGWAAGLWAVEYLQAMHDTSGTLIATVPAGQLGMVGAPGNTIIGTPVNAPPPSSVAGTYLGASVLQGLQAQILIDEMDNAAQQWLTQLTTTDGATLTGFGSILAADQYNYTSPLQWFPGTIAVTESADPSGYPQPTAYSIADSSSTLFDLLGLAGGYATIYTLTDLANAAVGGTQPTEAVFDGDPFPVQGQTVTGSATLHDRALGMLRVLLIDIDRIHLDPASGWLVDHSTLTGGTVSRGTTVATQTVAYALVALRTVRRALGSQLAPYDNASTDTLTAGTTTVLDSAAPLSGAPGGATLFSDRIAALIDAEGQLLLDGLTTCDGHAYAGWDVAAHATTSADDTLDAHAAAIRGLLAAYQATGTAAYLQRALAVFARMDAVFFDPAAQLYMASPLPQTTVAYTPSRFATLEAALRELYEVADSQGATGTLGATVQARLARLIKLVLDGWDDINGNQVVDYATECMTLASPTAAHARGGLQMAERAPSGELGSDCASTDAGECDFGLGTNRTYTPDREHDCVPEISAAGLPAVLANQVTFARP